MRAILALCVTGALQGCTPVMDVPPPSIASAVPTVFLRVDKPQPPPTLIPAEGTLEKTADGCVVLRSRENFLVFWPEDTQFDPSRETFQISPSTSLTFGDRVRLAGTPAGISKASSVGGVSIPPNCPGYNVWIASRNGVTKL